MKIHGISLTQLVFRVREPVVVHRPWFAARFNLQTERRNGVCRVYQMVVLVRCLLANVSTHDGQMCLLLRVLLSAYTRSRSDSSRTTIRFPHFYSLHFALLFPLFFILLLLPPPPFSSSPPGGRRDPVFIISECRGEACNFTEFYPSNFISCIRGPRNPGWNTVEIIAAMIFCLFVLMDRMESNRSRRIGQDSI